MKWRVSFDWEPKTEEVLTLSFLVGVAWCFMTLFFHFLLLQIFDLSGNLSFYRGSGDVIAAYLLSLFCGMPLWITLVVFVLEKSWKRQRFLRTRLSYGAFSAALLLWCWWILRTGLSSIYGAPANTEQAAVYAGDCASRVCWRKIIVSCNP